MTTIERVIDVIAETLGMKPEEIRPDSTINEVVATDSLDRVDISMNLEEAFGVMIDDDFFDPTEEVTPERMACVIDELLALKRAAPDTEFL